MTLKKALIITLLYAANATIANPLLAASPDIAVLRAIATGDMKKMVFSAKPADAVTSGFVDQAGAAKSFTDFKGKILLVNFWATWCAPCRHEMPALNRLQEYLGGDDFEVIAVATGRNPLPLIERFFKKNDVTSLAIYRDPKQELARDMSVFGLPATMLLNTDGQEIARLRGAADWSGEDAVTLLRAVLAQAADD